ncbi:MAG: hypothetical protein LBP39_03925 [Rickettsiales bacterium]|jgi:transposase-like protein|nr:hypothetical protein [Rickettsiales bacterium]
MKERLKDEENNEIGCKHCGEHRIRKCGFYSGQQRYYCNDCHRTFTLSDNDRRLKHPILLKRLSLTLYLSGVSLRGIQKSLNICFSKNISFHVIVDWIKSANSIIEQENHRRKEEKTGGKTIISTVEMDELYTYVKKNPKIKMGNPTLINEYGLLWIDNQIKLLHLK